MRGGLRKISLYVLFFFILSTFVFSLDIYEDFEATSPVYTDCPSAGDGGSYLNYNFSAPIDFTSTTWVCSGYSGSKYRTSSEKINKTGTDDVLQLYASTGGSNTFNKWTIELDSTVLVSNDTLFNFTVWRFDQGQSIGIFTADVNQDLIGVFWLNTDGGAVGTQHNRSFFYSSNPISAATTVYINSLLGDFTKESQYGLPYDFDTPVKYIGLQVLGTGGSKTQFFNDFIVNDLISLDDNNLPVLDYNSQTIGYLNASESSVTVNLGFNASDAEGSTIYYSNHLRSGSIAVDSIYNLIEDCPSFKNSRVTQLNYTRLFDPFNNWQVECTNDYGLRIGKHNDGTYLTHKKGTNTREFWELHGAVNFNVTYIYDNYYLLVEVLSSGSNYTVYVNNSLVYNLANSNKYLTIKNSVDGKNSTFSISNPLNFSLFLSDSGDLRYTYLESNDLIHLPWDSDYNMYLWAYGSWQNFTTYTPTWSSSHDWNYTYTSIGDYDYFIYVTDTVGKALGNYVIYNYSVQILPVYYETESVSSNFLIKISRGLFADLLEETNVARYFIMIFFPLYLIIAILVTWFTRSLTFAMMMSSISMIFFGLIFLTNTALVLVPFVFLSLIIASKISGMLT